MNLFKVLLHPDREEQEFPDRAVVARAANLLQVGEFQLLQLAYKHWHDEPLPEERMSWLFKAYMLEHTVPPWARHYARRILELDRTGQLNENDPAYHEFDRDYHTRAPGGVVRFLCAAALVMLAIGGGIFLANLTTKPSMTLLPPYFNSEELKSTAPRIDWGRSDSPPGPVP